MFSRKVSTSITTHATTHVCSRVKNNIKKLSAIIVLLTLGACSSAPTHLIVSPEINSPQDNNYNKTQIQLDVIDMRTSNHIVQISEEDQPAIILSSQQRLDKIIKSTLTQSWQQQGLTFNNLALNKVTILIDKAIISVNQTTLSYDTQSEIVLRVSIKNNQQTLTNTFKIRSNSNGPLQADIAVLERDFNQQLTQLLSNILASKDIITFL